MDAVIRRHRTWSIEGDPRSPCELCKRWHDKRGKKPDCGDCIPDILPGNVEAVRIFHLVSGQRIMAFGGTVDINHLAVWEAIDRFHVIEPLDTFEKVILMAQRLYAEEQREAKLRARKDTAGGPAIR